MIEIIKLNGNDFSLIKFNQEIKGINVTKESFEFKDEEENKKYSLIMKRKKESDCVGCFFYDRYVREKWTSCQLKCYSKKKYYIFEQIEEYEKLFWGNYGNNRNSN